MKRPRFSIGILMVIVALVALDFGVIGWAGWHDAILLAKIAVPLVMFDVAVVLALKSVCPSRAFWIGFALFGFTAIASVVKAWANVGLAIFIDGTSTTHVLFRGNALTRLWYGYERFFEPTLVDLSLPLSPEWNWTVLQGLIYAVPQLVIALMGGLLFHAVHRLSQRRLDRPGTARNPGPLMQTGAGSRDI